MYVDLKQPRGDGERCVTPARAAAKETKFPLDALCRAEIHNIFLHVLLVKTLFKFL